MSIIQRAPQRPIHVAYATAILLAAANLLILWLLTAAFGFWPTVALVAVANIGAWFKRTRQATHYTCGVIVVFAVLEVLL